jgi:hypothetical protein
MLITSRPGDPVPTVTMRLNRDVAHEGTDWSGNWGDNTVIDINVEVFWGHLYLVPWSTTRDYTIDKPSLCPWSAG